MPEGGNLFDQLRMRLQFESEEAGRRIERDVVAGRPEPAADDQRVGGGERFGAGGVELLLPVAGDQGEADGKPERAEFAPEKREVGIENGPFQEFGSG